MATTNISDIPNTLNILEEDGELLQIHNKCSLVIVKI